MAIRVSRVVHFNDRQCSSWGNDRIFSVSSLTQFHANFGTDHGNRGFLFLQNVMIFSFQPMCAFPQAIERQTYSIGFVQVSNVQLLILAVSVTLMILLQLIVKKTRMGKAMRAVSVDADAARLMGINVNRTISFTFALGSALAAAGGMLIGLYYNSIDPSMGVVPGLKSFVAAVLGGSGSFLEQP